MGKLLRDFTIEELEALPVGARFVDPYLYDEQRDLYDSWTYTKQVAGEWIASGDIDHPLSAASMLEEWVRSSYTVDDGATPFTPTTPPADPLREALQPFAQAAAHITEATPDDFALLRVGDAFLTAGDFRRAARALGVSDG
jgi:hypothetical protein